MVKNPTDYHRIKIQIDKAFWAMCVTYPLILSLPSYGEIVMPRKGGKMVDVVNSLEKSLQSYVTSFFRLRKILGADTVSPKSC